MQIDTIHSFLLLCKEKNMHRCSEILNITQQGLSRQMQSMEQELGCQLFVRSHSGVNLTPEGEIILPWLEKCYQNYNQARTRIAEYKSNKMTTIHLAVCPGVKDTIGLNFFYQFMTEHPEVQLKLDFESDAQCEELLQADEVDAAFLDWPEREQDYDCYTIIDSPIRLVMRRDHPLAYKPNLSINDIAGERCYFPDDSHYMTRHFKERRPKLYRSLHPHFASNDTSSFATLPLTMGGIALTFQVLTKDLPEELVARPLKEDIRVKVSYCIKKDRQLPLALQILSDYIYQNIEILE